MAPRPDTRTKLLVLGFLGTLGSHGQDAVQMAFLSATDHVGIHRFHLLTQHMEPNTARTTAFQGAATAMLAEVDASVWAKWRHCRDGMRLLDEAVAQAPADPELRSLRFAVADATPGFLGFRTHLLADAEVVIAAMEQGRITPSCRFWRQICVTLLNSDAIGPGQRWRLGRVQALEQE